MANKKINVLVIGGSGFLGSHIVDELIKKKYKVLVYDLKLPKNKNSKANYIKGNISNIKKIQKIIDKCNLVYNFAGIGDLKEAYENPISTIKYNILLSAKILECCIKYKIERYIYASSIYALSDNGSFYRCSKQAAENYIIEYNRKENLNYTILRFGSLYGPRSNYNNGLYKIIENYFKSKTLSYFGSKLIKRNYIYVKDAAKLCVKILNKKYQNQIVEITGKKKIIISEVMRYLSKILKYKKKIRYQNISSINHYIENPYTYKINYGLRSYINKEKNFKDGLKELIDIIKGK